MAFLKGIGTFIVFITLFSLILFIFVSAIALAPVLLIIGFAAFIGYAVYDDHKKKKGR